MRVSVVIASLGRPDEVGQLLDRLQQQTSPPNKIVISAGSEADVPPDIAADVQVVYGPNGLAAQRNRGMEKTLGFSDVIVFFDDDYLPSIYALEGLVELFTQYPSVVGATGLVLADGVAFGGIDYASALDQVIAFDLSVLPQLSIERDLNYTYGCNMAFRVSAIGDTKFDEKLALYGWQEDVDFAARMLPKGRIVKTNAFVGVHRGITRGRTSGIRLGYSQIVNPVYLFRKGTMSMEKAAMLMIRNFTANHILMFRPERWVDRRGRAKGNWLGIFSILLGKTDPRKVLDI